MANFTIFTSILLLSFLSLSISPSSATRKLTALVPEPPIVLKYHKGPVLEGKITVNLVWYGKFPLAQKAIINDFLKSLSSPTKKTAPAPSVASWWKTTASYRGGPRTVAFGDKKFDEKYSLGKSLNNSQIQALTSKFGNHANSINVLLTSADVAVEDFCMNRCGTHGSGSAKRKKSESTYAWVGNSEKQCPGFCAWPFHKPVSGPQTTPLRPPNRDVGIDGMIINLATVLAGTVTNPFNDGYYQGSADAPLEAVSACTGIFGKGAYPGFPGEVLVDKTTKVSYNANGVNGRKYLLPAMWNPDTSACKTLV